MSSLFVLSGFLYGTSLWILASALGVMTPLWWGLALGGMAVVVRKKIPPLLGRSIDIVLVLCLLSFSWKWRGDLAQVFQFYRWNILHAGFSPVPQSEKIVLPTGVVAYADYPAKEAVAAALFFHGSHPDGSWQSSALVLRRALLKQGYIVLSVDHPGYGQSPIPRDWKNPASWDYLPSYQQAYDWLKHRYPGLPITLVGHSLGTRGVLYMLSRGIPASRAILFGASTIDPSDQDPYWYKRFHTDRRMQEQIPFETFLKIRDRYYNSRRFATQLPKNHAPLVFVNFEYEHDNIKASRDGLYSLLSEPKSCVFLENSNHYFYSRKIRGVLVADTRILSRASCLLQTLQANH